MTKPEGVPVLPQARAIGGGRIPTPAPGTITLEQVYRELAEHREDDRRDIGSVKADVATLTRKQTGVLAGVITIVATLAELVHRFL